MSSGGQEVHRGSEGLSDEAGARPVEVPQQAPQESQVREDAQSSGSSSGREDRCSSEEEPSLVAEQVADPSSGRDEVEVDAGAHDGQEHGVLAPREVEHASAAQEERQEHLQYVEQMQT